MKAQQQFLDNLLGYKDLEEAIDQVELMRDIRIKIKDPEKMIRYSMKLYAVQKYFTAKYGSHFGI